MHIKTCNIKISERIQRDLRDYPQKSTDKKEESIISECLKNTPAKIVNVLDEILENVLKTDHNVNKSQVLVALSKMNNTNEPKIIKSKVFSDLIGGGEDKKVIFLDNESDSEVEEDDEEDGEPTDNEYVVNTKNSLFTVKQWGEDEDNLKPAGINYKSKMSGFKNSAEVLRKAFQKRSIKKIGETKAHVEEVKRKGTGTELSIKVTDTKGDGEMKLSFWGPNKKTKETTIQINIKGVHKKTRPPKSLKYSKSKTLRARKLKHSQPVYLIR